MNENSSYLSKLLARNSFHFHLCTRDSFHFKTNLFLCYCNFCLLITFFIVINMVKLFFVAVCYKDEREEVTILKYAADLASFGFFQRRSVEEFMKFTSKMIVQRSQLSSRCAVKEQDYLCHMYNRHDRLCCVLISDHEYPQRVAQTLLTRILDEFASTVPNSKWQTKEENSVAFPQLAINLTKYQDPKQADALTKLQTELDETKVILHGTITSLLNRGEKLDDLVAKSDDLSAQSKVFYKTARKTTQCCSLV